MSGGGDHLAYNPNAMDEAGEALRALAGFINSEIETLETQAKAYDAATKGALRTAVLAFVDKVRKEQTEISALATRFGATTAQGGQHMASVDHSAAGAIG